MTAATAVWMLWVCDFLPQELVELCEKKGGVEYPVLREWNQT